MKTHTEISVYEQARRRVGFKIHATVYAWVTPVQWLIWALTWTGHPWPVYPTLGWGLGLLMHYWSVYRAAPFFSVAKEMENLSASEK